MRALCVEGEIYSPRCTTPHSVPLSSANPRLDSAVYSRKRGRRNEGGWSSCTKTVPLQCGDFTRAMNNNSSSSSRWNSGSSFCDGDRRDGMKTKPKRKRKALCCAWLFLSFTPTPQLLTVGCVMCTTGKEIESFGRGSVGNADDVERTTRACSRCAGVVVVGW